MSITNSKPEVSGIHVAMFTSVPSDDSGLSYIARISVPIRDSGGRKSLV